MAALVGAAFTGPTPVLAQHTGVHERAAVTHLFNVLPDGGTIEVQVATGDPAAIATLREHLQHIAGALEPNATSSSAQAHLQCVPGGALLLENRAAITATYREIARGGAVRLVTQDATALRAVHGFLAVLREHHEADGTGQANHHSAGHQSAAHHAGAHQAGAHQAGAHQAGAHQAGAHQAGAHHGAAQQSCPHDGKHHGPL